jgi:glycosyltransferase involved in cell wall biosynthesis
MSVVLLIRSLGFGGAERQLVELAKGLAARGFRIHVIVFYAGGPFLDELHAANVQVEVLEKRGRWDVLRFMARLVRAVWKARPQVVYSLLDVPNIMSVLLKLGRPKTLVVWGVLASNVDFRAYGWFGRFAFRLSCSLARFADLILVNSTVGAEYHRTQGYPAATMVVLPSGVDVGRFRPDRAAGQRYREVWGIKGGEPVVGIVGRLDPMKDHQSLFAAAALLRREHQQLWIVCVGEGDPAYCQQLRLSAVTLGVGDRVLWIGGQREMTAVYNALDVLCSASAWGEGWSNVLGEAIACGIPCVATDVGDAAQIVGDCGVVVPPRNPEVLAEGIRSCLARAGDDLRRSCRKWAVESFSHERMLDETHRLLRAYVHRSV